MGLSSLEGTRNIHGFSLDSLLRRGTLKNIGSLFEFTGVATLGLGRLPSPATGTERPPDAPQVDLDGGATREGEREREREGGRERNKIRGVLEKGKSSS